jgi:SAM-dependent methyltransferase
MGFGLLCYSYQSSETHTEMKIMNDRFEQPYYPERPCPICISIEKRLLFRQSFSRLSTEISLLSGYDVVVCSKCGFCYADRIPGQFVIDAYYRDLSKYEKAECLGSDTPYEQARFQKMAKVISKFLNSHQTRIFEIGCANGQLLALLRNSGYSNVSGIDPSPVSAATAQKYYNIQVTGNTLSDVVIKDGKVDFVILAGVLEHVRELIPALRVIKKMLSIDGRLFITVPDASRYTEGEDAPFQEFSIEHINFFGPESLTNLLLVNGFKLVFLEQDSINPNYWTTTPVIHGVFERTENSSQASLSIDTETEAGLVQYINQSKQVDRQIQEKIEMIVSVGQPIIVWGTGAHTFRLLVSSALKNANIRAFVDSNPRYQGKKIGDVPVISPLALRNLSEPILISSRVYQEEIAIQIQEKLRLKNKVIKLYEIEERT